MVREIRKSGINAIGDIPWGARFCLFYRTTEELIDILVPYFREGLKANEFCLWITSDPLDRTTAEMALRESVFNLDKYIAAGQMEITHYTEWFLHGGSLDLPKVASTWAMKLKQAAIRGFDGLRGSFDMNWLEKKDWQPFMEFERRDNDNTSKKITLCTYSLDECGAPEIIEAVSSHQLALINRGGKWESIETHERNRMELALDKRVKELRCLYDIASITGTPDTTLREKFEEIATILPRAFQNPDNACAQITLNGDKFKTKNYHKTEQKMSEDIIVLGATVGTVEVGYTRALPASDNGIFSKEEMLLLEAVAERLGAIAEHGQAEENIIIERNLGMLLSATNLLQKAFKYCLVAAITVSEMDCGGIYSVNKKTGDIDLVHYQGLSPEFIKYSSHYEAGSPNANIVMAGKPVYTRYADLGPPISDSLRHEELLALAVVPITHEGEVIACINVASHTRESIPPLGRDFLETIASQIGSTIARITTEDALQKSEEKFFVAFHSSPDLMVIVNLKTNTYVEVNEAFTHISGYSREELIGHTAADIKMWEYPEEEQRMIQLLGEQGKFSNEEYTFRTKSGELRQWLCSAEVMNIGGEPSFIAVATDITERKKMEDALQKSEEKFSKAFRTIPDMITIATIKGGKLIEVNDSFTRLTGYRREEMLGRSAMDLDIWTRIEDRDRMLRILEEKGRVRNEEFVFQIKSGELRNVLLSAERIDLDGEPCIIAVSTDITEQKQSQELLQSISHSSPLGIYIVRDDKLVYTNPQFQMITGYSEKELLGRELLDIVAAEDADVVKSSMVFTLQEANPYPCEYRILKKTGQIKWVMQTVSPIHHEGREAILGNLMDITERKYLERKVIEYEELSQMKSDLLATVSHELRTPLATIKGYATMILDYFSRLTSQETKDYLKSIDSSTDRLSKLVDNLLDTSRMEAGLLNLEKSMVSISQLIQGIIAEASIRDSQHHTFTIMGKRLPKVNIDAKRIRQVLDNLIDNAIKYSPPGTEIVISSEVSGNELLVSISDHGVGIPAGELTNIFDRMYRIEQRVYSGVSGMGLGLYIAQGLVEAHDGKIWAESTLGQGSTIKFTIPILNSGKSMKQPARSSGIK
jgi:PAS domain S-box-containing protein